MKLFKRKKKRGLITRLVIIIALAVYLIWGNCTVEVENIAVSIPSLPQEFDGYKIAHISDLHNGEFGKNNSTLIKKLKNADPDIIVITGDIIDMIKTDFGISLEFVKQAVDIAPVYYVTGNHEASVENYSGFEKDMINLGVTVLGNTSVLLEREGESVNLIGVDDPSFYRKGSNMSVSAAIEDLSGDGVDILLSHRPELFDIYAENNVELVLSGHAHGGQFRIPFIGGLYAPGQGVFPEYDSGLYTEGNTNMVVSRGIGNSIIPVRFNNTPQIVVVELKGC